MKKQSVTRKKNAEDNQTTSSQNVNVIYSNLFILKGTALLPLKEGEIDGEKTTERKFRSVKELEQIILKNSRVLIGERTFLIPLLKKEESLFPKGFAPKGLLLDLGNIIKPRFYFLDIVLSEVNFYTHIFPRITKFLSCFKNKELMEKMQKVVVQNKSLKKELQGKISEEGIIELVKAATCIPYILLASDGEIKELSAEIKDVYSEILKTVRCVFIRKFSSNGNALCSITPSLGELHLNGKKRIPNAPSTEDDHLKDVSEEIKTVYKKIKIELLKANKDLQFNPQKYYISMRKDRNRAFFHFSRKRITLVVMNPEKETRKQIKHHEVKTLTEKVQKFWNGPSCSIVIENSSNLQEVINLLKKIIKH
jgi:predicted transport protein